MSNIKEIQDALEILHNGISKSNITILHCNTIILQNMLITLKLC